MTQDCQQRDLRQSHQGRVQLQGALAGGRRAGAARPLQGLAELQAEPIAVPPFALKHLRRGHAIHFRCQHPQAPRMRVDVMAKMRGVDSFPKLWKRRTTLQIPGGEKCDLLSLPDLLQAKKTQCDKDWPMIRRLVEAHYFQNQTRPKPAQIRVWFQELRTPELLLELARRYPAMSRRLAGQRPLLAHAAAGAAAALERALLAEETAERQRDKEYWLPLRRELEKLRHAR